jgi:hypothetical protein
MNKAQYFPLSINLSFSLGLREDREEREEIERMEMKSPSLSLSYAKINQQPEEIRHTTAI